MDDGSFDRMARVLGRVLPRRALPTVALAVLPASLPVQASARRGRCLGIGQRCGRDRQPGCGRCCSGFASASGRAQLRCTCRPQFGVCERDDQCCTGLCLLDPPSTGSPEPICVPFPPFPPPG